MRDIILLFIFILSILPVGAVQIISLNQSDWTCYEYSVDYVRSHPDFGTVTISDYRYFRPRSHMMNYKIVNNDSLIIHDGYNGADYIICNWQEDVTFMHFWKNETPLRSYRFLRDNRAEMCNSLQ